MRRLQKYVLDCIHQRGYGITENESIPEYNVRQYLKATEEMGEIARYLFDRQSPPATEIADVIIPLLAMAEMLNYDLETAITEKVENDIERGIR